MWEEMRAFNYQKSQGMDGSCMSKFRKRPIIIDAFQWFKHGDVEQVVMIPFEQKVSDARRRKIGWLETPQGGHLIFPGDWIIIDNKKRLSSCNSITFTKLYESVEPYLALPKEQGRMV